MPYGHVYDSEVSFQFAPSEPGIMVPSGYVPLVCSVFPLEPGYVRTKCADTEETVAASATRLDSASIVAALSLAVEKGG